MSFVHRLSAQLNPSHGTRKMRSIGIDIHRDFMEVHEVELLAQNAAQEASEDEPA
jgi:hypothetical protein